MPASTTSSRTFELSRPMWLAMLRCYQTLRGPISTGNGLYFYGMSRDDARGRVLDFFIDVDYIEYLGSK